MSKRGRPKYPDLLTPREQEVLEHIRGGLSNPEIATRLGISVEGVKYHVSEILGKLGVSSRDEAARWTAEQRPWWLAAVAPFAALSRKPFSVLPAAVSAALILAVLAGLGALAFFLTQSGTGGTPGPIDAAPRLAFSAGGSVYTVSPDGSDLRKVIKGDRTSSPNAAPAISPDGTRIAFVRDFDIWIAGANGSDARLLADVAKPVTPPGADNPSTGAQTLAWSPDGKRIAYVLSRIGGSGISDVWVMNADGSQPRLVYTGGASWNEPAWVYGIDLAIYDEPGTVHIFTITDDRIEASSPFVIAGEQRHSLTAILRPGGQWLVAPITREDAIMSGAQAGLRQVAQGMSPALSPDGASFVYFQGDTLRVASTDGANDHQIVDLAPLGGRDRFFGEPCTDQQPGVCSYHPPVVSWSVANTPPTPTTDISGTAVWTAAWPDSPGSGWIAGSTCANRVCQGVIERITDAGPRWQEQYRGDVVVDQLQFVDAQNGWALGTKGTQCRQSYDCPSALLRTTDGGAHWTEVLNTPRQASQMSFVTPGDGWLFAQDQSCTAGQQCNTLILKTTDGGETWKESALQYDGASRACLSLPTASDAWLATGGGLMLVSHDGGTWLPLPQPAVGAQCLIFFLTAQQGWLLIAGGPTALTQPKELFGTVDGGQTWTHLSGVLGVIGRPPARELGPSELSWGGYPRSLLFTSPENGWLVLEPQGLFRTVDGGKTWNLAIADEFYGAPHFVDAAHGWVLGRGGALWITADGGTIWTSIALPHLTP